MNPDHSREPFPRIVQATDLVEHGQRQHFFYFVRRKDLVLVVTEHIPEQAYWSIDQMVSPVIEFSRCAFDERTLRPGRLYYNESYYDENGTLKTKPNEFLSWAKRICAKIRGWLKYDKELLAYIGPEAELMRMDGIELALN